MLIQIILHMPTVSSGPLLSIHSFCSIHWFSWWIGKALNRLRRCAFEINLGSDLGLYSPHMSEDLFSHGLDHMICLVLRETCFKSRHWYVWTWFSPTALRWMYTRFLAIFYKGDFLIWTLFLMLSTLDKIFCRQHIEIVFLFFPENSFLGKTRKQFQNVSNLLSAEIAQSGKG